MTDLASYSGNNHSCLLNSLCEQLGGWTGQAEERYWVIMVKGEMTGAEL